MNKDLKEVPAGVADDYTEQDKARRANEVSDDVRQIRTIRGVMIEMIEELQREGQLEAEKKKNQEE
jgi:hypothetical protein